MDLPIIGTSREEAIKLIESLNLKYRISKNNGEYYILTQDYNPQRINLTIINNIITAYTVG